LAELRTLPEGMRENVARLLVATEANLDDDPQLALRFAQAAKKKAARVAMVREAVGLAAYAAGDYTLALSELRAVRRMSGSDEHLATMADCERALGRPRKALELLASVPESQLSSGATIEARLVGAGARRDLGQPEAAAVLLDIGALTSDSVDESIGRLRYAYADLLIELGRLEEARTWFTRAGETEALLDVEERLTELQVVQD
jgi:tetratricopeptide (TPR) repeat protein